MPKPTYDVIATQTLGTATSIITFDSIPQTYTDLVISTSTYYSASAAMQVKFNNDSATNYSYAILGGSNAAGGVYGARTSNLSFINILGYYATSNSNANIFLPTFANIMNYSNSNMYKTILSRSHVMDNGSGTDIEFFAGTWRSNSAITRVDLNSSTGNFAIGSMFTIYGIKG